MGHLWQAAKFAAVARNESELRAGTEHLAAAMQSEGLDRWRRFMGNSQQRAEAASTVAPTDALAPTAPVPFVDDQGKSVVTPKGPYAGQQMLFPAGLDPHFFVAQGLKDRQIDDILLQEGQPLAAASYQAQRLINFIHYLPWDAQRIGGTFHNEYVDYATVAIGLYSAALGLSLNECLSVQNFYASHFSTYSSKTVFDPTYTGLPTRNVANTQLGYQLYQSGLIGPAKGP